MTREQLGDQITEALDAARAQGRREGLEEAARIADYHYCRVAAAEIRAAIAKEPTA